MKEGHGDCYDIVIGLAAANWHINLFTMKCQKLKQ